MKKFITKFIGTLKRQYPQYIGIFVIYLTVNLLAIHLVRMPGVAPASILAPRGIALAAVMMFGYAALVPLALGTLMSSLIMGSPLFVVLAVIAANAMQMALTLFILDTLKVSRALETPRDFLFFIGVVLITTAVAPTISSYSLVFYNTNISAAPLVILGNLWIAGLLSTIVLTPLLLRLVRPLRHYSSLEWFEVIFAIVLLDIVTYVLTYTPTSSVAGISLLFPFAMMLLWIALRSGSFFISVAMLTVSVSALSGILLGHPANPGNLSLSSQIVNAETSLIVFTLLFYFISALEENRRIAAEKLLSYTESLEKNVEEKSSTAMRRMNSSRSSGTRYAIRSPRY